MPAGGQTSATLPDKNVVSFPTSPPMKYSAMRTTTRVNVVRFCCCVRLTMVNFRMSISHPPSPCFVAASRVAILGSTIMRTPWGVTLLIVLHDENAMRRISPALKRGAGWLTSLWDIFNFHGRQLTIGRKNFAAMGCFTHIKHLEFRFNTANRKSERK